MKHFWTRWAVLLISIIFISSCGGSKTSAPTPLTPEGTAAVPTDLTNTINSPGLTNPDQSPHIGQVGNTTTGSKSYYTVPVTGGITYTITLYGLSADADLWVYDYHPFNFTTGPVCNSHNGGTANEQCVVTAKRDGLMNIEVDGEFALSGATYSISVNQPLVWQACGTAFGSTCFNFDDTAIFSTGDTTTWYTATGFVSSTTVSTDISLGTVSQTVSLWSPDCSGGDNYNNTGCNIHSAGVTNGQTSCVSYTYTTTSQYSYVSFNYTTNSTTDYDLLSFYIDNVLQFPVWSGSVPGTPPAPLPWQNVMFNTTTGTHTYKWCHSNSNTDANPPVQTSGDMWVDDIYIQ